MRIVSLFLIFILISTGCSKKTTRITEASSAKGFSSNGFIYALPRNVFMVSVESLGTHYTPGPFALFAEKYLGIKGVRTEPRTEWQITNSTISAGIEADLQQIFVVDPSPNNHLNISELNRNGLIIPIRNIAYISNNQTQLGASELPGVLYTDLSHTPFIASERTSHISRVFKDSAFVRVPVSKTIIVEKSLEDKAREAADFIFSLRKRRFDMLSGDADFVAEGKAVEAVLKEINRLEKEYLTLFIGSTQNQKMVNTFQYTPAPETSGAIILFRFSTTKGVLPVSDLSGNPVLISTTLEEKWENTEVFSAISSEKSKPRTDALYYRVPVPVTIRLTYGTSELLNKRETAHQFGPLVRIPAKYLQ